MQFTQQKYPLVFCACIIFKFMGGTENTLQTVERPTDTFKLNNQLSTSSFLCYIPPLIDFNLISCPYIEMTLSVVRH